MRKTAVSIHVSDLHLDDQVPAARAETKEQWLDVQRGYLHQLAKLRESLETKQTSPVFFYAGDVFNHWDTSPEIINLALQHLPGGYAVPGQHELPNHDHKQRNRSAFATLCHAGLVAELYEDQNPHEIPYDTHRGADSDMFLSVDGFPWGAEITPNKGKTNDLKVMVAHSYIWTKDCCYPNAPTQNHVRTVAQNSLKGYDLAHFGDNHIGFTFEAMHGCKIFNGGSFMRRRSDEQAYKPRVGVLYSDGDFKEHYLDTSKDRFVESSKLDDLKQYGVDPEQLIDDLRNLSDAGVKFKEVAKRYLKEQKIVGLVAKLVLEFIEEYERGEHRT